MKKLSYFLTILLIVNLTIVASVKDGKLDSLNNAVCLYLLKDSTGAAKHLNQYFRSGGSAQLKKGYTELINGKKWDATRTFNYYLTMNQRSPEGQLGIALSTTDMSINSTTEFLERLARINPSYSIATLCLAEEYVKMNNIPEADKHFRKALAKTDCLFFRILYARFCNNTGQYNKAEVTIGSAVKTRPDNFHLNYQYSRTMFGLGKTAKALRHAEMCEDLRSSPEVKLLKADLLTTQGKFAKARVTLQDRKVSSLKGYNKLMGRVLFELNDPQAPSYLYKAFRESSWDKDTNLLLGRYHQLKNSKATSLIENWIIRSFLAGIPSGTLSTTFNKKPAQMPGHLPFFSTSSIFWLNSSKILLTGRSRSGDSEQLYIVDSESLKILKTVPLLNNPADRIVSFKLSPDRSAGIIAVKLKSNLNILLYAINVDKNRRNIRVRRLNSKAIDMNSVSIGFNRAGNIAYMVDGDLAQRAFTSPFSIENKLGKPMLLYPRFKFKVFKYNFPANKFSRITDISGIANIPLPSVKKYFLVNAAFLSKSVISDLIKKSIDYGLASTTSVRIDFAEDLSGFIIHQTNLTEPFEAMIYTPASNRVYKLSSKDFDLKRNFSSIKILDLNTRKSEVFFQTIRSNSSDIIRYNYRSKFFTLVGDDLVDFLYNRKTDKLFMITERPNRLFYPETEVDIVTFSPYFKRTLKKRRDIKSFVLQNTIDELPVVSTNNGELLVLDEDDAFRYMGPSPADTNHAFNPDFSKVAAVINGRLCIIRLRKAVTGN